MGYCEISRGQTKMKMPPSMFAEVNENPLCMEAARSNLTWNGVWLDQFSSAVGHSGLIRPECPCELVVCFNH